MSDNLFIIEDYINVNFFIRCVIGWIIELFFLVVCSGYFEIKICECWLSNYYVVIIDIVLYLFNI